MFVSAAPGSVAQRSIELEDQLGVQTVYGLKQTTLKPRVCSTSAAGGILTIRGSLFDPVNNEVWFSSSAATDPAADPRVRILGAASSDNGTRIVVTIPNEAGPGDIVVRIPGINALHRLLSNAFPTDLQSTSLSTGICEFSIANIAPSIVEALVPGTDQFLTVTGTGFLGVTEITLEPSTSVPATSYTIVNDNTITIDLPQATSLGANALTLDIGSEALSAGFTITAPAAPKLQLGSGVPFNTTATGELLSVITSGAVGTRHVAFYSESSDPSNVPILCLGFGNNFTQVFQGPSFTIPAAGYFTHLEPIDIAGPATVFFAQTVDITTPRNPKFGTSNLQTVTLTP